jgi:hypothetical protein
MAKHERTAKTNNEKTKKKHRRKQQDSELLLEQQFERDHGALSLTETPFHPRINEHAALLAETPPGQRLNNFVLQLEKTYGNKYVQRLIESVGAQAKLTVNPPNDIYEQEADRIGEAIIGTATLSRQTQPKEKIIKSETLLQSQESPQNELQMQSEDGQQAPAQVGGVLANAFSGYSDSCACGERFRNNCAHFLSDALIRSGCSELDGGTGALYRRRNGRVVCKAGRPVRAKELRAWFESKATEKVSGEPEKDGYWVVYQHDGYVGGHVLIHKHTGSDYEWKGTGDYPDWGTQEHYRW